MAQLPHLQSTSSDTHGYNNILAPLRCETQQMSAQHNIFIFYYSDILPVCINRSHISDQNKYCYTLGKELATALTEPSKGPPNPTSLPLESSPYTHSPASRHICARQVLSWYQCWSLSFLISVHAIPTIKQLCHLFICVQVLVIISPQYSREYHQLIFTIALISADSTPSASPLTLNNTRATFQPSVLTSSESHGFLLSSHRRSFGPSSSVMTLTSLSKSSSISLSLTSLTKVHGEHHHFYFYEDTRDVRGYSQCCGRRPAWYYTVQERLAAS